jgi:hypothetical protein
MDSREIEAQIKGLLGLQLSGGQAATEQQQPTIPPGAYPRQKNRYENSLPIYFVVAVVLPYQYLDQRILLIIAM